MKSKHTAKNENLSMAAEPSDREEEKVAQLIRDLNHEKNNFQYLCQNLKELRQ